MDWGTWQAAAAVWGALLSTVLLGLRFLEARPIITLEVVRSILTQTDDYRLRFLNPSKHPVMINYIKILKPSSGGVISTVYVEGWELKDLVCSSLSGRIDTLIKPETEMTVRIVFDEDHPNRLLMAVSWSRHKPLIFPTIPKLLYRGPKHLASLRQHPIPIDDLHTGE